MILSSLILADTVSVSIAIEGPIGRGLTVSAVADETGPVEEVVNDEGIAVLALPPDADMMLLIDGREAGVIRTPPAGYRASIPLRWPPTFTLRIQTALPDVSAAAPGRADREPPHSFLIVPLEARSEPREVKPSEDGAILIDWLLPGDRFDLMYRGASQTPDAWLWYAGPFEVEANAVETLRFRDDGRIRLRNVEFETGSARFAADSAQESDRVLELLAGQLSGYLAAHPELVLDIEGHTDDVGSAERNLKLSQKRADAVRRRLVYHGLEGDRIVAAGHGETTPLVENDSNEGRAINRRVELSLLKRESSIPAVSR